VKNVRFNEIIFNAKVRMKKLKLKLKELVEAKDLGL